MNGTKQQILEILSEDCRTPLEQIATMTGQSLVEVAQHIEELERDQIILRYRPIINWDKAERQRVEAMIEVRVTPQRDFGFDAVAKRIYRFSEVKSLYLMSGNYDLLIAAHAMQTGLTLVTNNTREFARIPGLHVENWVDN